MRSIRWLTCISLGAAGAVGSVAAHTGATIYPDGWIVVRQTWPRRLPAGFSTITIPLRQADPTTLIALDPGVSILSVRFPGLESDSSLLQRSIGRRLRVLRPNGDTVAVRILSADPVRLELPTGEIVLTLPGVFLFPADIVASQDSARVTVEAARPIDRLRVAYRAFGASWRARYLVWLASPTAIMGGSALLISDAIDLDSSEIQLYAGQIGQSMPRRPERGVSFEAIVAFATRGGEPTSESIGSHRLYPLPGRHRLTPGETAVVPSSRR